MDKPSVVNSILFIPGIEVKSIYGHILGIDIKDDVDAIFIKENPIDAIHETGGKAILAHPFDIPGGKKSDKLPNIDAIEVINASVLLFGFNSRQSKKFAKKLGLPITAGSDSHMPRTVGYAYVKVEDTDFESALKSILNGRCEVYGEPIRLFNKIELNTKKFRRRFKKKSR